MSFKSIVLIAALVAASFAASDSSQAQGRRDGSGPVGQLCASAIESYCAGLPHGNRAVRNCLERNRDKLSGDCLSALDNTGRGRGMGRCGGNGPGCAAR
jgi:hypothetical protein